MADTNFVAYSLATPIAASWLNDLNKLRYGNDDATRGASLLQFIQAGSGASTRTAQAKLREFVSAKDFGALGDGSTDDTSAIQAAINALVADRGGTLYFPAGVYILSSTLTIGTLDEGATSLNKAINFQGAGSSEAGGTAAPTVLKWTGGASKMLTIGTDARNVILRDFDVENTGTATMFCQVGFTDMTRFENINIRPTTFFSTAAITLGYLSKRCENVYFDHVTIRGTAVGNVGLAADRAQDLRAHRLNLVNCRMSVGIAASVDIVNAAFHGCSFNTIAAETSPVIDVFQARSLTFHGCHFESNSSNYLIDVGSTGTEKRGILLSGCYFSGVVSGGAPYLVNLNFAGCDFAALSCYAVQFPDNVVFVRNQSSASVVLIGNAIPVTGAVLTSSTTAVTGINNILNSTLETNYVPSLSLINGQLKFPATANASADANTLDDYEEGTFTPTVQFGGAAVDVTYGVQTGYYTKIGNRVFFDLQVTLTSNGSSTGDFLIAGLPFSSANTTNRIHAVSVFADNLTGVSGQIVAQIGANVANVSLSYTATGTATALSNTTVTDTAIFRLSGHYGV